MKKYIANSRYVLRQITDEYILIPTESDGEACRNVITANETVAFIWNKLKSGVTMEELVDALTEEYDVAPQTAQEDMEELFVKMIQLNIIRAV